MTNLTLQNADVVEYVYNKNDNKCVIIQHLKGKTELWFIRIDEFNETQNWKTTYSVNAHSENEALTVAKRLYEEL